ncbi:MAG: uracil-DNA glycosylase [Gemmatimonadales bacterium]
MVRCERCPRLVAYRQLVARTRKREFQDWTYWGRPVPAFGDPAARLLIVGLAPAAHGANRTGRMFTGDSSGDWLYDALHRYGFADRAESRSRDDGLTLTGCWIMAAARCAPPDNKPTREELVRCRPYLERELGLLGSGKVVLVLGRVAWESWLRASGWWDRLPPAKRPPFVHGAEATLPDGRILLVSYHPSRQNTNTGKLTRIMWYGMFERARELVGAA